MEEIWKPISGYEELYEVSSFGNVASLNYLHTGKRQMLKPRPSANGYYFVQLFKNKIGKMIPIHRLVALSFVANPNGFGLINHKDENKHNNRAENLEWCTNKYNVQYSIDRNPEKYKEIYRKAAKNRASTRNNRKSSTPYKHSKRVIQFDLSGNIVGEWENIAYLHSVKKWSSWSILECCLGKRKTAYGFRWQFAT